MSKDASELVQRCDKCQKYARLIHKPSNIQHPIGSPWPFAVWGMDILGPFPTSTTHKKFLIVAIDHFTKWVEVEAVPTITEARIQHFFWKEVICRFGLPHTLIINNGKQFDNEKFKSFCSDLRIKLRFTSVAHPQKNGLTEVTNRTIMQGLKKRLDDRKGNWADELNNVI